MQAKVFILGLVFLLPMLSMIGCIGEEKPPPPLVTEQEKQMAINEIEQHGGVRDAAISQDGDDLSLAIIVDYNVTSAKAKELGENFVRLVKSFSKDEAPGQEIGSGIYDYLIGVYYPNKKDVVMGAKSSISGKITW